MPLPASATEVHVYGHVLDWDGAPIEGVEVSATPSVPRLIFHSTDDVIYPKTETDTTDVNGFWNIKVIASNDPDGDPASFSYTIKLSGPGVSDSFPNVGIPYDAPVDANPPFNGDRAIKLVALVNGGTGEGNPFNLAGLADVELTSLADAQLLVWDSVDAKWKNADPSAATSVEWANILNKPTTFTPATHTHELSSLSDVVVTTPVAGQKLRYNGTEWQNVEDNATNVDGLSSLLDGKADVAHQHFVNDIQDIAEVGKTGSYDDLLDVPDFDNLYVGVGTPLFKPSLPTIGIAKMMWGGGAHGFVNVGTGGVVDINDTSDFALGDRSIKLTATTSSATDVAAGAGGLTPIDVTGMVPVIWLKVENIAAITNLRLWIGEGATPDAYVWQIKETSSWPWVKDATGSAAGEGWYRISLPYGKTVTNGTPPIDLSVINYVRLEMSANGTGTAVVHWGGLGFAAVQDEYPNGVITLRMDDLLASQHDTVAPILDKYGYACTAYAIAQTLRDGAVAFPDYCTLSEAHKLEELHGWEIGSHANTMAVHNQVANQGGAGNNGYTAYSSDAQLLDMYAVRQYLFDNGFRAPHHFAYPQGAWDEVVRANVRKLFTTGMTMNAPTYETIPVSEPSKLRSIVVTNTHTLANVQGFVDQIKDGKDWGVICFHDIVTTPTTTYQWSTADFEDLIDYIAAEGIPVRVVSEVVGT
jgi:hypothetical protein